MRSWTFEYRIYMILADNVEYKKERKKEKISDPHFSFIPVGAGSEPFLLFVYRRKKHEEDKEPEVREEEEEHEDHPS